MNKHPLSSMDKIKASEETKSKTLNHVLKRSSKPTISLKWVSFACIVALMVTSLAWLNPVKAQPYTYITLDINPSFELVLDKKDQVIKVTTFNQKAETIIKTLDLKGQHYKTALEILINDSNYQQYFTSDAFLQISIYSENTEKSYEVEKMVCEYLDQSTISKQYGCACVDKEAHQEAKNHHMSSGKYMMINEIIAKDASYTLESLEDLPMGKLKKLYNELTGDNESSGNKQQHRNHHR